MRSLRITGVGVALLVILAFSAMGVASSATAAVVFLLAQWLRNGVGITETLLALIEGEQLFENKNAPVIKKPASITCSWKYDGTVGPDGADEITELLILVAEELVSATPLTGKFLTCTKGTGDEVCETGSKVWAVNLSVLTLLVLWEEGGVSGFADLLTPHTGGGNPGWYIECKTALVTLSEECTTPELVAEQVNVAGGVESVYSEAFTLLMEGKLMLCTGNNEETGVITGSGIVTSLPGGGTLTASSEG